MPRPTPWLAPVTTATRPARRGSGREVDSDRPQALVQRFEGELHDLAFGVAELGDVSRIRRVERAGDERQALDQRLLDDRRVALGVVAHGFLEDLDAEAHVPRLVAC